MQLGLDHYLANEVLVSATEPLLIDHYLDDAVEVDVDALSDGTDVEVIGIMQHVEEAGVHSGDSSCCLPPHSLPPDVVMVIREQAIALAKELGVVGVMNVQFAVQNNTVYLI